MRLKIRNGEDIRRISLKVDGFKRLVKVIRRLFAFDRHFSFAITYEDDEKDQITISSDLELYEALKFKRDDVLNLYIIALENGIYSSDEESEDEEAEEIRFSLYQSDISTVKKKEENTKEEKKKEGRKEIEKPLGEESPMEEEIEKPLEEKSPMEEKEKETEKPLEETNKEAPKFPKSSSPRFRTMKARNGRLVDLDTSENALIKYGLFPYQRVVCPDDSLATVVGVDKEKNYLWFLLDRDKEKGVSYWDDIYDIDTLLCKGILPQNTFDSALSLADPNMKEDEMLSRALRESLIDQEQRRIQNYYFNKN